MSKFWAAVTVLFAVGLVLTFYPTQENINFTDLETECRYDRGSSVDVGLENRRLTFSGYFPVKNPDSDLTYDYSQNDEVNLNIKSSDEGPVLDFYNNCKATAVYDAKSAKLEPGRYTVTVRHDGEKVDERIIRVE